MHRRINNKISINDSDHIVCSFEHVRNDIIKYFNVDSNKVSVCPPPFAEDWFLNKKEVRLGNRLTKNIISERIIYSIPPRPGNTKTTKLLIQALNNSEQSNFDVELVCTGNKTNYYLDN